LNLKIKILYKSKMQNIKIKLLKKIPSSGKKIINLKPKREKISVQKNICGSYLIWKKKKMKKN